MGEETLKFRGVSATEDKFVYGLPSYNSEGIVDTLTHWDFIHNTLIHKKIVVGTIRQATLCETHYNDGKMIYDGDIIEFTMPDEPFWGNLRNTRKQGKVRYEPDYGGYIIEWEWSKNQHHVLLDCNVAFGADIIGNEWGIKTDIKDLFRADKVDLSDLSFSGIVSYIQHDNDVAKKFLLAIVEKKFYGENLYELVSKDLRLIKTNNQEYELAIERVVNHMKYPLPLMINDNGRVITIDEKYEISVNQNII